MPLSMVDITEKGKQTVFKVPVLNLECTVKSQNNRSANVLRRKVSEAKEKLAERVIFLYNQIKSNQIKSNQIKTKRFQLD